MTNVLAAWNLCKFLAAVCGVVFAAQENYEI